MLTGGALLLLAAFAPVAVLKLVPLAEAAVVHAGHQRSALRSAANATGVTAGVQLATRTLGARLAESGSGQLSMHQPRTADGIGGQI